MVSAHYSRSAYNGAERSDTLGRSVSDFSNERRKTTSHRSRGMIF